MNELIKVRTTVIDETEQQTVDARELHAFLEVGTRFNDWITRRISEYGFQENVDYSEFCSNLSKTPEGG